MIAATHRRAVRKSLLLAAALIGLPLLAACSRAQGATPVRQDSSAASAPLNVTIVAADGVATPAATVRPTLTVAPQPGPAAGGESGATTLAAVQPAGTAATTDPAHVPVRIAIARIGVNAPIVPLGETASGAMATPETPTDVGWWQYGVAPGEVGSAVLGGHLDFHDYGAAVFWNLNKLRPGDEVDVTRADGTPLRFIVQGSEVYPETDTAVIDRIFRQQDTARLNLITCAGTFNAVTRDYDKRLVVYTVLAQ